MQPVPNEELYHALRELTILEPKVLDEVYTQATKENAALSTLLVDRDLVADRNMGKAIAELLSLQFVELSKVSIPHDTLYLLSEIVAKKHRTIAFSQEKTGLKVATSSPRNRQFFSFLEKKVGEPVSVFYTTEREIENALSLYKKGLEASFDELLQVEVGKAKESETDRPIEKIFELLIDYAYTNKASDIHIEPGETHSVIRFRIDGILHDVLKVPSTLHAQLLTRIKVLAKLRTDEHSSAQDGKLQMKLAAEELDVRVSIVPITGGEKSVLRLLSSRSRQFSLVDLGLSEADLNKVRAGFQKPFGMVLSTGPTGSGKTTTIYSILKILNTREKNIATIEDPVEYEIQGVNQIQVNPKTNLTFADGLRSILRQDPNIIFVGEIRDPETAGIAVNSAMTGHLVLSTLHTNDAATALPRLLDMDVEPYLVASTVNVIIAQRLIRKVCESCRVSKLIPVTELSKQLSSDFVKKRFKQKEVRVYEGAGCAVCHESGYFGRIGVFEVLVVSEEIKKLITNSATASVLRQQAIKEGMVTMFEDGVEKVLGGLTTIAELLRATKE